MSGVRGMLARVRRVEDARKPATSRLDMMYGSFEAFETQIRGEVDAGALDGTDWLGETGDGGVLRCLRRWKAEGLC